LAPKTGTEEFWVRDEELDNPFRRGAQLGGPSWAPRLAALFGDGGMGEHAAAAARLPRSPQQVLLDQIIHSMEREGRETAKVEADGTGMQQNESVKKRKAAPGGTFQRGFLVVGRTSNIHSSSLDRDCQSSSQVIDPSNMILLDSLD